MRTILHAKIYRSKRKEQEQSMVTKVSQQPKPGIRVCLLCLTEQVKSQQHHKEGSKTAPGASEAGSPHIPGMETGRVGNAEPRIRGPIGEMRE